MDKVLRDYKGKTELKPLKGRGREQRLVIKLQKLEILGK